MTDRSAGHDSFTIERRLANTPGIVFNASASPDAKARWFYGRPGKWTLQAQSRDFRVGGREHVQGAFAGGPVARFDALYYDSIANERILYADEMHPDEARISVSLATVEFAALQTGQHVVTRMRFTEQAVFPDVFDDADSRERGTSTLPDQFAASLADG